jgi:hypothetical protein
VVQDALDIALLVAAAIDAVGGEYFIGGSVASSLQGEPRATNDIDVGLAKWFPGDKHAQNWLPASSWAGSTVPNQE